MEFEQIYSTYFKSVYHYIWQLSGNVQSAVTNGHWCGGKRPQCGASAVGLS